MSSAKLHRLASAHALTENKRPIKTIQNKTVKIKIFA